MKFTSLLKYVVCMLLFLFVVAGCTTGGREQEILLATTTSTYDSGLLDELVPAFESQSGYVVKVIAVGTGKALAMGREGNADVLLVHAPSAEEAFMAQGYGMRRERVMSNDFVLLCPPGDPAAVRGVESAAEGLRRIAVAQALFVSRGDDSGTHKKERALWEQAGLAPQGDWYLESGQGMGATLRIASEKEGYTLSDRGTYLALRDELALEICLEGDPALLNVYHVIVVNAERWPDVNVEGANALADFLLSSRAQRMIAAFGVERYGQPLFLPNPDQ